jgi:hypothetical protein
MKMLPGKRKLADQTLPEVLPIPGLTAKVHVSKGGGTIFAYSIDQNTLIIHLRERNVRFECSLGELEAIAALHNTLQERK